MLIEAYSEYALDKKGCKKAKSFKTSSRSANSASAPILVTRDTKKKG